MSPAAPAPLGGVLNVDKPAGWTSHDVVARVRRLAGLRQVGHAGTLDPMATGVLVLCLGRATRLLEFITGQPKSYLAEVTLGVVTDTYDAEGEVVSRFGWARDWKSLADSTKPPQRLGMEMESQGSDWESLADSTKPPQRLGVGEEAPVVSVAQVERALDAFRGAIMQRPPAFSALKRDGVPLYQRARAGEAVEVEPRPVMVYELTLLHLEGATLRLHVRCGAGVYVRSIAHDLGQALGCGAHLSALRRTAVGPFVAAEAVTLEHLAEAGALAAALQPADAAVAHLPAIAMSAAEASRLLHGQAVAAATPVQSGPARAYGPDGRFLGIVAGDERGRAWRPSKMLADQEMT
ncbi:MAG: tRNA pseudouridine(55) synthase TruB [Anaerolinea sp.]|nr:tRNA pseudouridine(55) synthase TruB [Anaerolinea sp.]